MADCAITAIDVRLSVMFSGDNRPLHTHTHSTQSINDMTWQCAVCTVYDYTVTQTHRISHTVPRVHCVWLTVLSLLV